MTLYTIGYRDESGKRRAPEEFYACLPEDAVVVDIREHPYSPFAPAYTGGGVAAAAARLKPGRTETYHVRALGNTRKDASGKRISPPVLVDPDAGYAELGRILEEHGAAVIFCACSHATMNAAALRCHRFFVADEMRVRMCGLEIIHLE